MRAMKQRLGVCHRQRVRGREDEEVQAARSARRSSLISRNTNRRRSNGREEPERVSEDAARVQHTAGQHYAPTRITIGQSGKKAQISRRSAGY